MLYYDAVSGTLGAWATQALLANTDLFSSAAADVTIETLEMMETRQHKRRTGHNWTDGHILSVSVQSQALPQPIDFSNSPKYGSSGNLQMDR